MSTTQLELGGEVESIMTEEQTASRDAALVRFQDLAAAKYEAGQKEHGATSGKSLGYWTTWKRKSLTLGFTYRR